MGMSRIIHPPDPVVDYGMEELEGSPTGEASVDAFVGHREWKAPWKYRLAIVGALRGAVTSSGANNDEVITLPHSFPGVPSAICVKARFVPWGAVAGQGAEFDTYGRVVSPGAAGMDAEHPFAHISADYEARPTDEGGGGSADPFVEESLEPFAEFLTLSHRKLFWDVTGLLPLKEAEAPQKLMRGIEWVYKIARVRNIPPATFDLIGCVNDEAVISLSLGKTFAAETLLYNPPVLTRQGYGGSLTDSVQFSAWTLEYRFTYRPEGWNKFHKEGNPTPQPIYVAGGTQYKPYTPGDFLPLVGAAP